MDWQKAITKIKIRLSSEKYLKTLKNINMLKSKKKAMKAKYIAYDDLHNILGTKKNEINNSVRMTKEI